MPKRIYIKESSLSSIMKGRLLPGFLFKMVKAHETSLGDSEIFPSHKGYAYDYIILKQRFSDICDEAERVGIDTSSEDSLMTELSKCVTLCKEMETPIRPQLQKVCENAVNRLFAIPQNMVNIKCELVDRVKIKSGARVMPEIDDEKPLYTFKDIEDIEHSVKAVEKRRVINSMIQGASYIYSNASELYGEDINKLNNKLLPLYERIRVINDYLLFTKKEVISDEKPMQGSYVETRLGDDVTRTIIESQGIIFPLLLHDTIKGLFELFSSHGLPQDRRMAQYIVKKADFLLAEPWDLRLGVKLWENVFGSVEDTNMIPYMFMSLVSMSAHDFNKSMKEILSKTHAGEQIIGKLAMDAEYDKGYQEFQNRINARNVDKTIINDSFFNGAENNGFDLDGEENESDLINEED